MTAFFLLTRKVTTDKVLDDLKGVAGCISVDHAKENALKEALARQVPTESVIDAVGVVIDGRDRNGFRRAFAPPARLDASNGGCGFDVFRRLRRTPSPAGEKMDQSAR